MASPVHFLKYLEQGPLASPVHLFKYQYLEVEQGSLASPVHFLKYLEQGSLWLVLYTSLSI